MLNRLFIAVVMAGMLTGCITSREVIVGRDANGNEIVRNVGNIDYQKAALARINLAHSFMDQKMMSSAKENLNIAEGYNPGTEQLELAWGRYYSIVGDVRNAEEKYKKVIASFPNSGMAFTQYGGCLCDNKRYDEGLQNLMQAISIPKFALIGNAYERAAVCAYESGQKEDSKLYFEQAINYGGNSASLFYNYAVFALEGGDAKKADQLMRNYDMFQYPDTPQTLYLKIKISQALGEYASSEIFGRKLIKYFPTSEETKKFKAGDY